MNLKRVRCPNCKVMVLAGDNDSIAAFPVLVDLKPIGTQGEALARLAHRGTYSMRAHGTRLRLQRRDQWQITGQTLLPHTDIVAEHQCGEPLPAVPSQLVKKKPTPKGPAGDELPPY